MYILLFYNNKRIKLNFIIIIKFIKNISIKYDRISSIRLFIKYYPPLGQSLAHLFLNLNPKVKKR